MRMRTPSPLPAFFAVALPLLLAAAASACSMTPAVAPDALPSSVLQPPSAAYLGAVEEGRAIARALVSEERLPGLSLAVAVNGEIVWAEGLGRADLETREPVTPDTLFRVGGVSETVTAAAVGLLSERGKLDLDAPVQRYVPGFPEKEWPITTRQLMAHMSGIRHYFGEEERFAEVTCQDDAQRLANFADDPLRFRPGTQSVYSAWGWVLVGAVVSGAANEPYLGFVQREVFAPLGMQSTVQDIFSQTEPRSAHHYYPSFMLNPRYGLQDSPGDDLSCILADGGFLSTPSDLVRLGSAMMGGRLLAPATVGQLQTPVALASGRKTGQALGWVVQDIPVGADGTSTRIVGNGLGDAVDRNPLGATTIGGHVSGGTAALVTVPGHGIAIAVTTNVTGSESVSKLSTRLAEIFSTYTKQAERVSR